MYENVPVVYTFDDHDFGNNNADGHVPSAIPANRAYKVSYK